VPNGRVGSRLEGGRVACECADPSPKGPLSDVTYICEFYSCYVECQGQCTESVRTAVYDRIMSRRMVPLLHDIGVSATLRVHCRLPFCQPVLLFLDHGWF